MQNAIENKYSSAYLPQTGIDTLLNDPHWGKRLKGKRVGLLANQSSLTSQFVESAYALYDLLGQDLSCFFAAEHGWSSFCEAGEHIENTKEPLTKLPVFSLYGPLFKKSLQSLKEIDVLIIDIQDVGVRCYTYAATCAKLLEFASQEQCPLEIIVCDRPNPLGKWVGGFPFHPETRSLVSYIDVPFQHGKTMGELLQTHNLTLSNPLRLSIIPCAPFSPYDHVWIPPSPALPDWDAVLLYPGLVLLEGTNVSEGRGSTLPFKCVAAPGLDGMKLVKMMNEIPESGIKARFIQFTPQSDKLKGQPCQGAQLHILDYKKMDALKLGIAILEILSQHYPLFEWVKYEDRYFIDSLTGSPHFRESLSRG